MIYRCVGAVLLCLLAVGARPPIAVAEETDRLVMLGRLWAYVKYSHPLVALGNVDWDSAVIRAIPAAKAATDSAAFARVVSEMLATLGDPLTRVRPAAEPSAVAETPGGAFLQESADLLVLRVAAVTSAEDAYRELSGQPGLTSVNSVLIDLRGGRGDVASDLSNRLLVSERLQFPAMRTAIVTPFERFQSLRAAEFVEPEPDTPRRRAVFVVDRRSPVPWILYSLRSSGTAQVICVGEPPDGVERVESFPLDGGYLAQIRVVDLTIAGKRVVFGCDQKLVGEATTTQVDEASAALLRQPTSPPVSPEDPTPIVPVEARYATPRYPDEPQRILAVYRFWAAVHYLSPNKHLMDRPWDDTLAEFIPKAAAAPNELEYVKVIAAMGARLQDSHVVIQDSPVFRNWLGAEPSGTRVRWVEGKPIVTGLLQVVANGPAVGDEILEVNGESVADRIERISPYMSFSTAWARDQILGIFIMLGERGTQSKLRVRREGHVIEVTTGEHDPKYRGQSARGGDVARILEGNIGYVNLARLEIAEVDSAFDRLRDTRGIIFDMRGYPRGTHGYVAAHLNSRGDQQTGVSSTRVIDGGWSKRWETVQTLAMLSGSDGRPPSRVYTNPTVMLIDAQAQSAAEFMGLVLRAANGTRFVGTSTTGANGATMTVPMPGGFTVRFTANGSHLQRVGLKPDIEVAPTIAGIRAKRDEVLERAVQYLVTGK